MDSIGNRKNGSQGNRRQAFGKATPKKIAAAKKEGGLEEKRAIFAQNMKRIAAKRKHRGTAVKGMTVANSGHRSKHSDAMKTKRGKGNYNYKRQWSQK